MRKSEMVAERDSELAQKEREWLMLLMAGDIVTAQNTRDLTHDGCSTSFAACLN